MLGRGERLRSASVPHLPLSGLSFEPAPVRQPTIGTPLGSTRQRPERAKNSCYGAYRGVPQRPFANRPCNRREMTYRIRDLGPTGYRKYAGNVLIHRIEQAFDQSVTPLEDWARRPWL